ncbi:MAG: T9SS type A sorting domain-containing protein [Fibrobacter sp.]|nr:T9SS type A sorting domain-containing protein [Fibrobacter sp.]
MMKRILVCVALMVLAAFACTKKLEYKGVDKMPYLLVQIDPFIRYEGGTYEDAYFRIDRPFQLEPNGKKYYAKENIYYSENDSNIVIFLGVEQVYLIRTCQSEEECEAQASENDILETFKYEFMRLQKSGVYNVTEEYADSVSNHIIDKLKEHKPLFEGDSTFSFVAYNSQCFNNEYEFRDEVTEGDCYDYPDYFTEEIDSCNAYLESLEAQPLARVAPANFDVQVNGGVLSIVSSQNLKSVSILSPLGRLLEEHHVAGTSATVQLHLPAGTYIALVKTANNAIAKKITVK